MSATPRAGAGPRRSAVNYSTKVHSQQESRTGRGDYTINPRAGRVQVVRPDWQHGPTVFRLWPQLSFDDQFTLSPGRLAMDDSPGDQFSQFIVRCEAAVMVGPHDAGGESATFILYPPDAQQEYKDKAPWKLFYWSCWRAFKGQGYAHGGVWDGNWNKYMMGGKGPGGVGRDADLTPPKGLFFAQGHIFRAGKKDYCAKGLPLGLDPDEDITPVMIFKSSVNDGIASLLNKRKDPAKFQIDPTWSQTTPGKCYLYGDPTGYQVKDDAGEDALQGGVIFTAFNPEITQTITKHTTWDGTVGGKDKVGHQGYEIAVSDRYVAANRQTYTASLNAAEVELVRRRWKFWWDAEDAVASPGLLRIPSYEEQAAIIARLKLPPRMIEFGLLAEHPEYRTDEVKGILAQRRSAVVPGLAGERMQPEAPQGDGDGAEFDDGEAAPPPAQGRRRVDPTQQQHPAIEEDPFAGDQPAPAKTVTSGPPVSEEVDIFADAAAGDDTDNTNDNAVDDDPFPDTVPAAGEVAAGATDDGDDFVDHDTLEPAIGDEVDVGVTDEAPAAADDAFGDATDAAAEAAEAAAAAQAKARSAPRTTPAAPATAPKAPAAAPQAQTRPAGRQPVAAPPRAPAATQMKPAAATATATAAKPAPKKAAPAGPRRSK